MTYLAGEQQNPPRTADCLKKIDTSSKFLLGLVNDILDMSKAESGKVELHPEPYRSETFLSYLDAVVLPLCREKNIRLVVDVSTNHSVLPLMDELRTNQIFFNLLSNAVKFTPEGGTVTCMRTPLNAIIGFAGLAAAKDVSPEVRGDLAKIQSSGQLLLDLINDTLTISKANNGKLKLRPEPVDTAQLFDSLVIPIRAAAAKKQITFMHPRYEDICRNMH